MNLGDVEVSIDLRLLIAVGSESFQLPDQVWKLLSETDRDLHNAIKEGDNKPLFFPQQKGVVSQRNYQTGTY